jgi:hypothetical protein
MMSGWAPPVGGEVGGKPLSPGVKESRTKVSGDEGCRREVEISSPIGRRRPGDGATRRRPHRRRLTTREWVGGILEES